jgi:phospholipid/cholesterol/gamma-HCH transport system substrate-binding protein
MNTDAKSNWKLGMFIIGGLFLFILAIYFIGKQQNMFGSNIQLKSKFKTVSGLKVGNNVRFSGINIGTVSEIELVNDTSVVVVIIIEKEVQKFIKTDAIASIGSDGLVGDKILTISPGSSSNKIVKENSFIASRNPLEIDDFMKSLKRTVDNAEIITSQLAEFANNMNNGDGALSKLMNDEGFANKLDSTMSNLESGTQGLSENMEAAKHNFLFRGYFNKKKKEAEQKKKENLKKQKKLEKEKLKKNEDTIQKK